MKINNDCIYFRGDIPCKPHKEHGYHCSNCPEYKSFEQQILIIKLGASGDVLRTTPILHQIKKAFPAAHITWITKTIEFVPKSHVNTILRWNTDNILWLLARKFDIIYSLDKDNEAIALASRIQANTKKGYVMDEWGNCQPADHEAVHKWHTGLWDDLCKENTKSYPQEIIELCGFTYDNDKYIINPPRKYYRYGIDPTMKIIGLNPGCGKRWLTRLWGEDNWIALSKLLNANGYTPILLGGHDENELNMRISTRGKALYFGVKPMEEMITIVNSCELVVTSVTMAMHVAIALEKKLVLLNNIFNKHEFELYGLGTILEPDKTCKCCYKDTCEEACMETIPVETVFNEIIKLIGVAK